MPKSKNQQLKILYVAKYLLENSDENNSVGAADIAEYIERTYGISAERRSVSRDINLLKYEFGMDIDGVKGSKNKVMSRDFNFRDLRIIAECIHSAKFISAAKSKELVKNLTKLCSKYQAKILETDTILYDRAKTTQNGVIKTVEDINAAMSKSGNIPPRKISFKYLKYNINNVHQQIERRRGGLYKVSPYKLLISDGNYYIDFLIDGIPIEVKTQTCQMEEKICIELMSNVERNYNGWFYTTAAQYLIFVDRLNHILYKIATEDLRAYYYKNKQHIHIIPQNNKNNNYKTSNIAYIEMAELADIMERIEIND